MFVREAMAIYSCIVFHQEIPDTQKNKTTEATRAFNSRVLTLLKYYMKYYMKHEVALIFVSPQTHPSKYGTSGWHKLKAIDLETG